MDVLGICTLCRGSFWGSAFFMPAAVFLHDPRCVLPRALHVTSLGNHAPGTGVCSSGLTSFVLRGLCALSG